VRQSPTACDLSRVDVVTSSSDARPTPAGPGTASTDQAAGHRCPFCTVATGGETPFNTQADIVRQNEFAIALICPRWWPRNKGHVLVVSRFHFESIYDLPREHGHAVQDLIQEIAIAIRNSYDCHGVSIRQHNEPAGGQDVPHYHAHAFPRFPRDELYSSPPIPGFVTAAERHVYAQRLRQYFQDTRVGTADLLG
jgi:histidine triad (HIT) family protein